MKLSSTKPIIPVLVFLLSALLPGQTLRLPQLFRANNIWNTSVDNLPIHAQSDAWLALVGTTAKLRIDDAIPVNLVSGSTPLVRVSGMASPDTDSGGWPITATSMIEGGAAPGQPGPAGTDSHFLAVDPSKGILYEIFALGGTPGSWTGYSGAKWDLASNALRTDGYTSADAGGLPILPGLLRYDEVAAGAVTHALRFTAPHTLGNGAYIWPARHYASRNNDGPPMGARVRLKGNFDTSGFSPKVQIILAGLKKYGAMLADNGMSWGMQFASDPRWDLADLATIHNILGASMEFVDASGLMTDPNSGAAGTPMPGVFATDLLGRSNVVPLGAGLAIVNGALAVVGSAPVVPPVIASIFVKTDTITAGSWKGVYGADGSLVVGDTSRLPSYATATPSGAAAYTWASPTTDKRGLQRVADRVAACWYSGTTFSIDLTFTDGKSHQVALYFMDWDNYSGGRRQLVEVLDVSGAVLDSRSLSGFGSGTYLVWNLSGHVTIRMTNNNPASNAVVNGIFFDPAAQ